MLCRETIQSNEQSEVFWDSVIIRWSEAIISRIHVVCLLFERNDLHFIIQLCQRFNSCDACLPNCVWVALETGMCVCLNELKEATSDIRSIRKGGEICSGFAEINCKIHTSTLPPSFVTADCLAYNSKTETLRNFSAGLFSGVFAIFILLLIGMLCWAYRLRINSLLAIVVQTIFDASVRVWNQLGRWG
ncbi:unnamed protein product, partial [Allacma fusca]